MITAYEDFDGAVPYPLPVEAGESLGEELQREKAELENRREQREYTQSMKQPTEKVSEKVQDAAGDIMFKLTDAISEIGTVFQEKRLNLESESSSKDLRNAFPDLGSDASAVYTCRCSAWNARSQRAMSGTLMLTEDRLLFHSEHSGHFSASWDTVLSLQKAVELPVEDPCRPYFLPIPSPNVAWDTLQVYCLRGRLYQFFRIRGGPLLRMKHEKSLQLLFLHSDRMWRQRVDVDRLVAERSDYAAKNRLFNY
eukprot:TRINITY_DN647_c10_g1_i1.p1 TRINITY_DN647_c10_g1~~TRINITY_DN647_c10_g1_i1.p1  ORF type:complete len:253 (+),score=32.51 TRINITY_DN647_c10_g1_i1:32-790(+)